MRRIVSLVVLAVVSPAACASDPSGLASVMLLQLALLAWPLVLPLFYLAPRKNKPYSYFLLVVLTFGSLGIVALPELLFTIIAAWFSAEDFAFRWVVPLNIAKHAIAFIFCLWYLPRFRKLLKVE